MDQSVPLERRGVRPDGVGVQVERAREVLDAQRLRGGPAAVTVYLEALSDAAVLLTVAN